MGDLCGIESIKELERVWAFPWLAFNTCHLIRKMLFRVIKLMLIALILSNFLINFANYPGRSIESWIERNTVRTAGVGSSINLEMFCYRRCMVHADIAYRVTPNRTIHLFKTFYSARSKFESTSYCQQRCFSDKSRCSSYSNLNDILMYANKYVSSLLWLFSSLCLKIAIEIRTFDVLRDRIKKEKHRNRI